MIYEYLTVESRREIWRGVVEMVFSTEGSLPDIKPGQFISIYPKNKALTLPRPFAINGAENGNLKIVFMVAGKGTEEFSNYKAGDKVKAMFPLGNGFDLSKAKEHNNHVLIGGSVGAAPLLPLAKSLNRLGRNITVYLGFKDYAFLTGEFQKLTKYVYVTSDNGYCGQMGTVIDLLNKYDKDGEMYYACGPSPMLKAVCGYISEKGKDGQVSVEERMACGFGACVGCAVKVKSETGSRYLKACKDGPVFNYKEVLWD